MLYSRWGRWDKEALWYLTTIWELDDKPWQPDSTFSYHIFSSDSQGRQASRLHPGKRRRRWRYVLTPQIWQVNVNCQPSPHGFPVKQDSLHFPPSISILGFDRWLRLTKLSSLQPQFDSTVKKGGGVCGRFPNAWSERKEIILEGIHQPLSFACLTHRN